MLVLSRRIKETIRFPQLGISVSIVSVKGNRVQVGVDAPAEIQILRKELESAVDDMPGMRTMPTSSTAESEPYQQVTDKERHQFKNLLNRATLGLHLAQKQLAAGQAEAADQTLSAALVRLMELEKLGVPNSVAEPKSTYATSTAPRTATPISNRNCKSSLKRLERPLETPSETPKADSVDVLLVEDDQNEQLLLRTLLEMEGYRVHTANNGLEAMKCLERITPQFVLLDMMMPECDGPETFDRMRAISSAVDLPIFAVSATSPESVGLSVGTDGIDEWFPKPLNAQRLVKQMRSRAASFIS